MIKVSSQIIQKRKTATVTTDFASPGRGGGLVPVRINPSRINKNLGSSQYITVACQDMYGNPIANQTLYLGTGIHGLWITQVNGKTITGSVNMGTNSSPSIQLVNTPVPLFNLGNGTSAPAYSSVAVTGLTASHLNDNTSPVIALATGDDGAVTIFLVDGGVTYVANSASTNANNSYKVDTGTVIKQENLGIFSNSDQTEMLGSSLLNWGNKPIV